ncbi:MAG: hypothetical protein H7Y38_01550 [Armatimonadetes bacterium]|nr:hypothetical protein [Armatimonadota bacterium]
MRQAGNSAKGVVEDSDDVLDERIASVFEATGGFVFQASGGAENLYWANAPQGLSPFDADIYFHYKLDKPQHAVLRMVRDLVLWPLLKRQVAFNHSLRNAVLRLWYERGELRRELSETRNRITEIEKKLAVLARKS